ncbi:hypothetical protein GCM10007160_27950 [Litchfieldella qijiaojingensis]|uniref:Uncharacterized protein n=1 Tax=Litchfieldella qijiaojingensis TaxID=980347 RepID=A0ABQ2Z157_9GAMM|nr:hypothetical protein GCM10007160_27950 [Halomonas qijiaojingensis]
MHLMRQQLRGALALLFEVEAAVLRGVSPGMSGHTIPSMRLCPPARLGVVWSSRYEAMGAALSVDGDAYAALPLASL